MLDTIDAVIIGIDTEQRFIIAVYDARKDFFYTAGRLSAHDNLKLPNKRSFSAVASSWNVENFHELSRYFYPDLVVEVKIDRIKENKKFSCGFQLVKPRIKQIRYDKEIYQATTVDEIKSMYELQNFM